ncbi:unnamed protein product, partial [Clonostachys rhizophaga]
RLIPYPGASANRRVCGAAGIPNSTDNCWFYLAGLSINRLGAAGLDELRPANRRPALQFRHTPSVLLTGLALTKQRHERSMLMTRSSFFLRGYNTSRSRFMPVA